MPLALPFRWNTNAGNPLMVRLKLMARGAECAGRCATQAECQPSIERDGPGLLARVDVAVAVRVPDHAHPLVGRIEGQNHVVLFGQRFALGGHHRGAQDLHAGVGLDPVEVDPGQGDDRQDADDGHDQQHFEHGKSADAWESVRLSSAS